jgi:DTW domain-containing protein YfiP
MGGRRNNRAERCTRCRMLEALCVCQLVPALETRHRWIFIQHFTEQEKTTNTGRLAHFAMPHSQRSWFRSRVDAPEPAIDWGDPGDLVLLYPREGVEPLPPERLREREKPSTIVVLDGTWKQTRKMARSIAPLPNVSCVGLPEGAFARFSLRDETLPGGMSTLDAVAWLAGAAEGPEFGAALARLSRVVWERTMASRGTPVPGGPRMTAEGLVQGEGSPGESGMYSRVDRDPA